MTPLQDLRELLVDCSRSFATLLKVRQIFHRLPALLVSQVSLETLRSGGALHRPALDALPTIPHVTLDGDDAERILRGIAVARGADATHAALVDGRSGALVALAEADGARWQPRVVMRKVG